jgi:hypothetical protein
MDKWLTVPQDLEPVIGTALTLYSLYRPKKNAAPGQGLSFEGTYQLLSVARTMVWHPKAPLGPVQ